MNEWDCPELYEEPNDPQAAASAALLVFLIAVLVAEGLVLGIAYLCARILFWALHLVQN